MVDLHEYLCGMVFMLQIGDDLIGEAVTTNGSSISINSDGNRLLLLRHKMMEMEMTRKR